MRSLALKLTLAFLIVSLTGTALAALFIQQRTHSEFDRYLYDLDKDELTSVLTRHYQETGSWEGIEKVLPFMVVRWNKPGQHQDGMAGRLIFTLIGTDGIIMYGAPDRMGHHASESDINKSIPLKVDGEPVGWLQVRQFTGGMFPGRMGSAAQPPESPEGAFLESINQAILISALIAMGIALLLGVILARTLTRPIRELTSGTQYVAQGELGYQVAVRSKDELGQLATSFNLMSADLAQATLRRRQMTADIAHDLRTPLSVLLGYTEALSDEKLAGTSEVYTVMHREAQHLSHLIDDLRTLSLADAGELPLNQHKVHPVALLERTAAALRPQADRKELTLKVETDPRLPQITVDPERMAQVLGNLVSNAIRYTPQGGRILLSATNTGSEEVMLQVEDNGPGIAPEDLPNIFDRFYRGDKSRLQNDGETGLGLAIAKSLVEAQGGSIEVHSVPGEGTRFTITLQYNPSTAD